MRKAVPRIPPMITTGCISVVGIRERSSTSRPAFQREQTATVSIVARHLLAVQHIAQSHALRRRRSRTDETSTFIEAEISSSNPGKHVPMGFDIDQPARPTDLTLLKEISVSIKVDVVSSGSWTTKRVTVSDVLYRTQLARRLSRGLPCVRAETPGAGTCSTALVYQRQKCHPS